MPVVATSPPVLSLTCSGCGWTLQYTPADKVVHLEDDDDIGHGARPSHIQCPRCKAYTLAQSPYPLGD